MIGIEVLKGKTLNAITLDGRESIKFSCTDGTSYKMYHEQDCCESVEIEDIAGELDWLLGSEITMAECETNLGETTREAHYGILTGTYDESFTWTFYKLATLKGYVTIRWYGCSNGYYSESVDFVQI